MGIKMTLKRNPLFLFFVFWTFFHAVDIALAAVDLEAKVDGTIDFNAREATLDEIFKVIREKFEIEVKGLEVEDGRKVSYAYIAGSPEDLLKSLLRFLGIKNYALEFADATLKRLVVVPETVNTSSFTTKPPQTANDSTEFVSVARIQSIVEGSQAESAGLREGDFILEYDGVRISSAQQLVREVEKKASSAQIELLFVRQKILSRLILGGGFIGVRVTTQRLPRSDVNDYDGVN